MFQYNRTTTHVGKWLVMWSVLALTCFSAIGFRGEWIGQKRPEMIVTDTALTSFADGIPCMRLKVVIRPLHFGGRVPAEFTLHTSLHEKIAQKWHLYKASWVSMSDGVPLISKDGVPQPIIEEAIVRRSEDNSEQPVEAEFEGLHQSDGSYIINLDLRPSANVQQMEQAYWL
jgi:hypothetical protein